MLRANLGSGFAMQGPGVRSVDAQLFDVKRLNIPNGQGSPAISLRRSLELFRFVAKTPNPSSDVVETALGHNHSTLHKIQRRSK